METQISDFSGARLPRLARIPLSRRNALVLGSAASLAIVAAAPESAAADGLQCEGGLGAADQFDELRARWLAFLVGPTTLGAVSPAVAERKKQISEYAAWALANGDRTPDPGGDIWQDLRMSGPEPANITTTYRRILRVAIAWATPGIDQYHDDGVERTLIRWYRHMTGSWYNAAAEPVANWWFWEIGIPRVLGDLTLVLRHRLAQRDVDNAMRAIRKFTPNPNRIEASGSPSTGSNRADKVLACLLRGIAARSTDDMRLARGAILDVPGGGANSLLAYRTSGDGFYADGSYIHHLRLPYAGPYGKAALAALAPTVMLLSGTSWELSQRAMRPILDSPALTFAPFIWNGRMMETVRGRTVAREHERNYTDAWGTAEAVMLLAGYVDEPYRSRYRSLAKAWLVRCSAGYRATGISDLRRAESLLNDDSVTPTPERPRHVQFGVQERMVHRGRGWAFTVATSSARIGRFGWGNGENRYGWHQGDGASYLYLDNDQGQFADDYWPTVDPYRLPGTTASLTERAPGPDSGTPVPAATNRWGGGVGLSRRWGTAGMDLVNELGDVRGKKSWFLLDDSVVAIGSGIIVTGRSGAETTVENRSFPAGARPRFVVDGDPVTIGERRGLDAPGWAHLNGVAGYVFLGTYAARASLGERTGSWHDINTGGDTKGSTTPRTRTYATLSLTHPTGTGGDRYAYVILPRASEAATRAHAAGNTTRVVRGDPRAHVVRAFRGSRWFLFAHLFEAVDDGLVRADGPCAVIATGTRDVARIAVSDPTKSNGRRSIRLFLSDLYPNVARAHSRLRVTAGRPVRIEADFDGARGRSFDAVLTT